MADEGKLIKMEVDYSSTVDETLPKCKTLAEEGKLKEALDTLLSLEKQTRTGADMHSTSRVLVAVVELCYAAKDYQLLNEHILLLSKRRSQLKQAVTKMVQKCCTYVDETEDKETKLKLIDTLRTVTAGKIYVEIERARLTLILGKIKETDEDVAGAAEVLHELQVETYGSMERQEKVAFILEQMRLCLATEDYIRTQIISKKINVKFFDDTKDEIQELKLKYYNLMIALDQHERNYLSICKHYRAVYDTACISGDKEKWQEILRYVVFYIMLSPYNNEQSDLMHRIKIDKNLDDIQVCKDLLELFTTMELVRWNSFRELYEPELSKRCAEAVSSGAGGVSSGGGQLQKLLANDVFNSSSEYGKKCWEDLRSRIVEHNIMVLAKYYTRISIKRMSELLELPANEAEELLCDLVVKQTVSAKTDRLDGVVCFELSKQASSVMNEWSHNLNSLMALLTKSVHLINKEEMVHRIK